MRIGVVGTGYVGLVTGVCFAEVGHHVCCVDKNKQIIDKLNAGIAPIFEPGLENLIRRNVEHERLEFTTSLEDPLKNIDVMFIAVGTPQDEDGSADLQYVETVAREIGANLRGDLLVVVKSTVPVGTCQIVDEIITGCLKSRQVGFRVSVASNPEFLKEGAAIDDFMKPDRIVVGVSSQNDEELFRDMYRPFVLDDPGKLMFMDRPSSELTKYGANAMLATRISFMNELARLCEKVGANIDNIRRGMGSDVRIGRKFLYAGPGYGGSCFPKDVKALLKTGEESEVRLTVLEAVTSANEAQKLFVARKINHHFGDLNGKRIALWGLAFKPGTDDVRDAPAIAICNHLLDHGAMVVGHDPQGQANFARVMADRSGLSYAASAYDALRDADGVVLATEWREYQRPNWQKAKSLMRQAVVFDFRNQYEEKGLAKHGFRYYCVGRQKDVV